MDVKPDPTNEIIWDFDMESDQTFEKNEDIKIDIVDKSEFHIVENTKKQENEEWEIIDVKNPSKQIEYSKETLLSNRETRNQIIANLYEVKFFF